MPFSSGPPHRGDQTASGVAHGRTRHQRCVRRHLRRRATLAAAAALAIAQLAVLIAPVPIVSADAGGSQFGGPMVVINPGGGILEAGADGLRIVVNSDGTGDALLIAHKSAADEIKKVVDAVPEALR